MLNVQKVDSLELPELAPYRTMRRPLDHREQGIFVAEGEKVVRRLLESHFTILSLLLPERWFQDYQTLICSRPENIPVYLAEKNVLEKLTGFSMFQGVLGVGKVPQPHTLEAVCRRSAPPRFFVAIEGLTNAENVGVMARNCAAFGVQALFTGNTSSSPFLRRAVRSSMGAIFQLPVVEGINLAHALPELRARGIRCVAAHPRAARRALPEARFSSDCCVVFGSEGRGISDDLLAACDEAVAIPMASGIDSLNVGSAAAVFFHEVIRQRSRENKAQPDAAPGLGSSGGFPGI